MINVSELKLGFGERILFKDVNLKFVPGNCYGIIGANGAGKSTFLKVLSGELEPDFGLVAYPPKLRMAVLRQDHFEFDDERLVDVVQSGAVREGDATAEEALESHLMAFAAEEARREGRTVALDERRRTDSAQSDAAAPAPPAATGSQVKGRTGA